MKEEDLSMLALQPVKFVFRKLLYTFVLVFALHAEAQVTAQTDTYKSPIDELLSVKKVSVLPFTDNAQGIYARPLESHLIQLIEKDRRWDFTPANTAGPLLTPDELEDDTPAALQVSQGMDADAFFVGRIIKGPAGISMKLDLFLKADGKLLAQAAIKDLQRFDLNELKEQTNDLLLQIVKKIPYRGLVLSRQGQRVTINLGRRDGVQQDQIVPVIQIISVQRHPKFNFLVSTEKEIIGRIKLLKIDESLSFGAILTEKERGAIRRDAKIAPLDNVNYPDISSLDSNSEANQLGQRTDNALSFGENPSAWVPKKMPSFGEISARFGLTSYTGNMNLRTAGAFEGKSPYAPTVFINGELWVTSEFSVHAGLKQAIMPVDNPRGGAPSEISQNLSYYELLFGYYFRFGGSVWDPFAEILGGYFNYKLVVDNSSPEAFTTMTYSGIKLGLRGGLPVSKDKLWLAGAQIYTTWEPALSETPITSGASSSNTINQFGIWGGKKLGENLRAQVNLDFELYSTTFSGTGTRTDSASSSSQRHTTLSGGLFYMF